jgi:hypothetical protein
MAEKYVFQGVIHPRRARVDVPSKITTRIKRGEHQGDASVHINAGEVFVIFDLEGELENLTSLRNLIENLLQSVVDPICYLTGNLLTPEISSVVLPDGESQTFGVSVPEVDGWEAEGKLTEEVSRIMALYDGDEGNYLRSSLADFKMAMDAPHETGFYCFRAIESIRQKFYTEDRSKKESWQAMRETLNIEEDDIRFVQQFADSRRHGDVIDVPGQSRKEILHLTWRMIWKFIDHLDENK